MTIALCMIVRDEAAIIERCLDSVVGLVDYVLVVDTGSTDDTREIVKDHQLPSDVYDRPWINFGHNRTELMELARGKADWLLLLDADMTVTYADMASVHLEGDAYMLRHVGDPEYWIKRLVRGDGHWWYVGATHEYITNGSNGAVPKLDAITVHHHYDGSTRPEKFTRDLELLTEELERDPGNARTVYYLANTLRDLGRAEEAIERYKQRADMGGWDEEVFEASLQAGMLADDVDLLFQAYNFRPTRAEPLYELAWRFRRRGMPHVAYLVAAQGIQITLPADTLFVRRWVYDWAMLFEFSIAAWWVGKRTASLQACDVLLMKPELPDSYREQVKRNRALCAPEDG